MTMREASLRQHLSEPNKETCGELQTAWTTSAGGTTVLSMQVTHLDLLCFSPTGTTRRVLECIADGLAAPSRSRLDLTLPGPATRPGLGEPREGGAALIGTPVYAGRVPVLAVERLRRSARGAGRPAVLVVVYGNRAFEDALLELRDLAEEQGFVPVAAAAFVGEHSFSTRETPLAQGRPDGEDLALATAFGEQVRRRLAALAEPSALPRLRVPGNVPYREGVAPADIAPQTRAEACGLCGACARTCPSGAVRLAEGDVVTEASLCLRCCACTRACPTGARAMADPRILEFGWRLHQSCARRREPELFF